MVCPSPSSVHRLEGVPEVNGKKKNPQGLPVDSAVLGRLKGDERFLTKPVKDPSLFKAMVEREFMGSQGKTRHKNGFNVPEFQGEVPVNLSPPPERSGSTCSRRADRRLYLPSPSSQ